jgi:hypothetical protein
MEITVTLLCTVAILGSHMFFIKEIECLAKMLNEINDKLDKS